MGLGRGEQVEVVAAAGARLGESPVWDQRSGQVAWVDILGRRLHRTAPETGETESTEVPLDIGAIAPRQAGGYVAALQDGFWIVGDGPARRLAAVPDTGSTLRFNDGKCDPGGRFWAGTMAYTEVAGAGSLYRLDPDGTVARVLDDISISNGLAWSQDGGTMFYIDTPTQRIDAFAYDVVTGAISDRRPLVRIPADQGSPDGLALDAEGGLWVALWGGAAVHRYVDGRLDHVIPVPVSRPTSCAFGGPDLDELFITSASTGLTPAQRLAEPLAGALFRIRPGVPGVAAATFAGP